MKTQKLTTTLSCAFALHPRTPRTEAQCISLLASTGPTGFSDLVLSLGSQYVLPIMLNAAQLAASSYLPTGNTAMLIDSAKVVVNIASASVATLRKNFADPQGPSALVKKAEDATRDALQITVPSVVIPDVGGATAAVYTPMPKVAPAREDLKDSAPEASTATP
jgi:hypothetical protein